MDLDRSILSKLQRILPRVDVQYAAGGRTGLFEGATDHYGEVWYELDGRKVMSRSTTEPIVLDTLFKLAELPATVDPKRRAFRDIPWLRIHKARSGCFYLVWPLAIGAALVEKISL